MILQSPGDVAFSIFNIPVYWYGIIMGFAVLVGLLCAERNRGAIYDNFFINNSLLMIIFGIVGARLYYCLLNSAHYLEYPAEIFDIRQGGLSIHGMIFIGILLMIFLAKKHKIKILELLDVCACSTALAQSIGRWGNFFNSEAFGLPTNGNWGVFIPLQNRPSAFASYGLFHPTFLYESILDFIIFLVLLRMLQTAPKYGMVFFWYLILYSIVRFFVECIRLDSALNISGIPIAQIVSVVLFVVGLVGLICLSKK